MSNKIGIIQKDGKLYYNGVEVGTGGGAQDASELIYDGTTTVADAIGALDTKIDNVASAAEVDTTDISSYGDLATYHPDECRMLANAIELDRPSGKMVRFIWLADTHTKYWDLAKNLLEHSKADFLVHTGDIIMEIGQHIAEYERLVNEDTKPSYVALGNHDLTHANLKGRYDGYIANNNHINLSSENFVQTPGFTVHAGPDKLYYSVTYVGYNNSECGWKAIYLFPPDGRDAPTNLQSCTDVVTSEDQIAWFIAELTEASVNNLDVMCFTHVAPDQIDRTLRKDDWYEWQAGDADIHDYLGGFCDIIDAFITGTKKTAEFPTLGKTIGSTYYPNETNMFVKKTYTVGFPKKGFFIGWFCGHNHCDGFGWSKNHPFQFISITDWYSGLYPVKTIDELNKNGTWVNYKSGVLFNYVNINLHRQRVDIMRCGNNELYDGTKHTTISYMYYADATKFIGADIAKTINREAIDRGRPQFVPNSNTTFDYGHTIPTVRIYFGCNSGTIYMTEPGTVNRFSGIELHYIIVGNGTEQVVSAAYDSSTPYVELENITVPTTIKAWLAFKANTRFAPYIFTGALYTQYVNGFNAYGGYGLSSSFFKTSDGVEYAGQYDNFNIRECGVPVVKAYKCTPPSISYTTEASNETGKKALTVTATGVGPIKLTVGDTNLTGTDTVTYTTLYTISEGITVNASACIWSDNADVSDVITRTIKI